MLLIVSPRSGESRHVKRELELAGEEGRSVVPVLIDGDGIPRPLRYHLAGVHWVYARSDRGWLDSVKQVLKPLIVP